MNTTEQTKRPLPVPPSLPTWSETIDEVAPVIGAPAVYGPPVMFVMGPWLLLVLLLVPPFALAFTVVLVVAVAAALLAALAALLASPYLLVRHLLAHRAVRARPQPVMGWSETSRVRPAQLGSSQAKGTS